MNNLKIYFNKLIHSFIILFIIVLIFLIYSDFNIRNVLANQVSPSPLLVNLEDYSYNEVIVTYNEDSSYSLNSLSVCESLSNPDPSSITPITDHSDLISFDSKYDLITAIKNLNQDVNISSIQPNFTYELLDNKDKLDFEYTLLDYKDEPYLKNQWWMYNDGTFTDFLKNTALSGIDLNLSGVWSNYSGGREVIVAIIDSGIDYTHEDLKDSLWINPSEISGDGIDNDDNGYIDDIYGWNYYLDSNEIYNKETTEDNHGTHCAGIIAASENGKGIVGITSNFNVKIMALKALGGPESTGTTNNIVKAIQYAENMGASICNISAGTKVEDPLMKSVIEKSNMIFVVSAGNGDSNNKGLDTDNVPLYPASFDLDNIISVANLQCDGNLHSSSNYGKKSVDIAAPGTSIYSTFTNNKYGYLSGTSMSAPMVTGVLAMVYSQKNNINLLQAKEIVLSTAKPLPSLTNKVLTGGMVDGFAAISVDEVALLSLDINPPTIKTKIKSIAKSYKKKLSVTVKDSENNLSTVRYAKGKKSIAYFKGGTKGKIIKLTKDSATLTIKETANYTIYATDSSGNEKIKIVKVTITPPKTSTKSK